MYPKIPELAQYGSTLQATLFWFNINWQSLVAVCNKFLVQEMFLKWVGLIRVHATQTQTDNFGLTAGPRDHDSSIILLLLIYQQGIPVVYIIIILSDKQSLHKITTLEVPKLVPGSKATG